MPLTFNSDAAVSDLSHVWFPGQDGAKTVRCGVSHEALQDLSKEAREGGVADYAEVYRDYADEVQAAASKKYDAKQLQADGSVIVVSADVS